MAHGSDLFKRIQGEFFGLERKDRLADGQSLARRYFDSAASCLMLKAAHACATAFLPHYANTHSDLHFAARCSSEAYAWAHAQVLEFLAAGDEFVPIFTGSGSTSGLNRLARGLAKLRPERDTVLVSLMEHHSNDLPHRANHGNVVHVPCVGQHRRLGPICLESLSRLLDEHRGRVNYVALTGASNVTGILNSLEPIARLVHAKDALLVVDGSQLVAHTSKVFERSADAFVFSGHKAYVPGAPGVLVVKKGLLEQLQPVELGGGMVEHVWKDSFQTSAAGVAREEAGTPNIVGAVMLAAGLAVLQRVGMSEIVEHEQLLLTRLIEGLGTVKDLVMYGDLDRARSPRVGIVTFNIRGMDHALVAAILNDYFNIAVRNECFCAHPYVRELLLEDLWDLDIADAGELFEESFVKLKLGMVRASLGLYNTQDDVDTLVQAVGRVSEQRERFSSHYRRQRDGSYSHLSFAPAEASRFVPHQAIEAWLRAPLS